MPKHTADLLSCWIRRGGSKSQKRWWGGSLHVFDGTVWKEKNARCFEDRVSSLQKIKGNCIANLHFWCKEENIEDVVQLTMEVVTAISNDEKGTSLAVNWSK
ncbi:hypothetical protein H5410_030257, partial [Solanum commersonii]